MDVRTQAWIDQEDARLAATVRRHGWMIRYIGGDECSRPGCDCPKSDGPPFAYTVGLFGLAHPELLIFFVFLLASRLFSGIRMKPKPITREQIRSPFFNHFSRSTGTIAEVSTTTFV